MLAQRLAQVSEVVSTHRVIAPKSAVAPDKLQRRERCDMWLRIAGRESIMLLMFANVQRLM